MAGWEESATRGAQEAPEVLVEAVAVKALATLEVPVPLPKEMRALLLMVQTVVVAVERAALALL
jgi:hypothetical protein